MISKKAKYALKALRHLAEKGPEPLPTLISEIAEAENIPKKFLEGILVELKNNMVVRSQKGKGGGYLLRMDAKDIKLSKILRVIDGPIAPALCVSLNFYGQCEDCGEEQHCSLRKVMEKVRDANLAVYDNTTVADLVNTNTIA